MVRVGSLFAGIGGIDLGFRQVGCDIVWANEKDTSAATTYRYNFGSPPLVQCDIASVDKSAIPKFDILTAGFPCQPFSVMGYQKGFKDPRGNLFFEIVKVIEAIMPPTILLENVKNLVYHDNGKTFFVICNTLTELGYTIKHKILNAAEHANIPQDRSRIFIAAFLDDKICDRFSFPSPIELSTSINDIIDRSEKHSEIYYYTNTSCYYETLQKRVIDTKAIYRIDDGGVAKHKYLICPTLKANMGTYHDRVPLLKDNFGIRKITPIECLKLQGFPPNYSFSKISLNEAYKQAGNTVCVPVIKRIAEKLLASRF